MSRRIADAVAAVVVACALVILIACTVWLVRFLL